MKNKAVSFVAVFVVGILVVASFAPSAYSVGLAEKENSSSWYFGKGLKPGDFFEYRICDYLLKIPESPDNCYVITLDAVALLPSQQGEIWIMSAHVDHRVRNVDFILQVSNSSFEMITDGSSIPYADSLERTLGWVMEFASKHKPQPLIVGKSWGAVASDAIHETELTVMQVDSVQMGGEVLSTYRIGYSLIQDSFLQVNAGLPIPITAVIYKPVSTSQDVPLEMTFDLLRYAAGAENACVTPNVIPMYSNYAISDESKIPSLPQKTEPFVNSTMLDTASKTADQSKNDYSDQLLDETNLNASGGDASDVETEYFDEADFRDKLRNSTTSKVLSDLYGPNYENLITSFDKFVELLTNATNAVRHQLNSTWP